MRTFSRYFLLVFGVLGGCDLSLIKPPAEPTIQYILEIDLPKTEDSTRVVVGGSRTGVLYLPDAFSPPQIDSTKILFAREAGVLDSYKYAAWSERPTTRLPTILAREIDRSGLFQMATRRNGPVSADYILDTEITDFYHDASSDPGEFRVRLALTLSDMRSRTVVGRQSFEASATLQSFDARGAVGASSKVMGQIVAEISAWLRNMYRRPENGL